MCALTSELEDYIKVSKKRMNEADEFLQQNYFNKATVDGLMKDMEQQVASHYFSLHDYQAFREEFEGYGREVSATFGQVDDRIKSTDTLLRDYQVETSQSLARKADRKELLGVVESLKKYALY